MQAARCVRRHSQQVGQHEAAPRRAQHGEGRQAVRGLQQRVRERGQVEHRLPRAQRVEFDRGEGNARRAQRRQDLVERRARAHEDRDCPRRRRAIAAATRWTTRSASASGVSTRSIVGRCVVFGRPRGHCGRERYRPAPRIAVRRQHRRKHSVDPFDHRPLRPEVAGEIHDAHRDVADASACLRIEEQAHFRVAEAVDRLHRIADGEQRAAVAVGPAGRELRQQLVLHIGRVLEFVDEQMVVARIEAQQQVGRCLGGAERAQRRQRELDEVDGAFGGEYQLQALPRRAAGRPATRRRSPRLRLRKRGAAGCARCAARRPGLPAHRVRAAVARPRPCARSRSAAPAPFPCPGMPPFVSIDLRNRGASFTSSQFASVRQSSRCCHCAGGTPLAATHRASAAASSSSPPSRPRLADA